MADNKNNISNPNGEIVTYQNDDGTMKIDATLTIRSNFRNIKCPSFFKPPGQML